MRVAFYARVSTQRQAQADGIVQQLERLQEHAGHGSAVLASGGSLRDGAGLDGGSREHLPR